MGLIIFFGLLESFEFITSQNTGTILVKTLFYQYQLPLLFICLFLSSLQYSITRAF